MGQHIRGSHDFRRLALLFNLVLREPLLQAFADEILCLSRQAIQNAAHQYYCLAALGSFRAVRTLNCMKDTA